MRPRSVTIVLDRRQHVAQFAQSGVFLLDGDGRCQHALGLGEFLFALASFLHAAVPVARLRFE